MQYSSQYEASLIDSAPTFPETSSCVALVYGGTYREFLWHTEHREAQQPPGGGDRRERRPPPVDRVQKKAAPPEKPKQTHEEKKRVDAEARKKQKAVQDRQQRIATLEGR